MDMTTIGIVGVGIMLGLIALGVPIAFSMAAVGALGTLFLAGLPQAFSQISLIAWDKGTDFVMVCIPLYIFMGQMVFHAGIAGDLFDCVQKWLGRLPGGLAITGVMACAAFGAVTGVSVAAVATMGSIIMPEMRKYKYDNKLGTGCLATSGTLAILIPPSLCMVFYGIMTDTSIGTLFIAGIIPGIILSVLFSIMIYIRCLIDPKLGPVGPSFSWKERFASLKKLVPVLSIFILVIGSIYGGFCTATEAAGIGASGILIVALIMKRLTWDNFKRAAHETGLISAMVFAIIMGGYFISRFLVLTEVSTQLVDLIANLNLNRYVLMLLFTVMYLILGCVLDVYGMLILTLPFVFPIILKLGFDPIWFGIYVTVMTEIALVTPPVGVSVYVMANIAPEVPMEDIFKGTFPFVGVALVMIGILMAYPEIALWLTRQ